MDWIDSISYAHFQHTFRWTQFVTMASVYKRNGSNIWQASYLVPSSDGGPARQIRRSTGKKNEREAKAVAADFERDALKEAGLTDDRCRKIQAILVRAGEDAAKMTLNATKARGYLAQILSVSTGEDMPAFTVRTWTAEWQARKLPNVAQATKARYKGSLKTFLEWLGDRADLPLESVPVSQIREFRDFLEEGGRGARTCQFYVADVGSVFRAAVREGLITYNPVSALEPRSNAPEVKRLPFSVQEVQRLLGAAPSIEWKGVILVGAFTGLRLGDASSLQWEAINLTRGTITTVPAKTKRKGRVLTIPMHPEVRAYFAKAKSKGRTEGPVFPDLAKVFVKGRNGLSRQFKEIMEAAKVAQNVSKPKPSGAADTPSSKRRHKLPERSFHSLRHTFTSWLANADVAPELRMKLTGHTTADIHAGYTHHELATLADAVTKLPKLSHG